MQLVGDGHSPCDGISDGLQYCLVVDVASARLQNFVRAWKSYPLFVQSESCWEEVSSVSSNQLSRSVKRLNLIRSARDLFCLVPS